MFFTTSDNFNDNEIDNHIGLVDSHIVIGANIFRDVFASFKDVFGGETKGYKKDLDKLKTAALTEIEKKAKLMGANAVIALKVDLDEISGGGKSMFMYNVSGSAVKFKSSFLEKIPSKIGPITDELLDKEASKFQLREKAEKEETLEYIIEEVHTSGVWSTKLYEKYVREYFEKKTSTYEFFTYIEHIPYTYFVNRLFSELANLDPLKISLAFESLRKQDWYDSEIISNYLSSDNYLERFRVLKIANPNFKNYRKSLIPKLKKVISSLENEFYDDIEDIEEIKKLTGTKKVYSCPNCLSKRDYDRKSNCQECSANFYGIRHKDGRELTYRKILNDLKLKTLALENLTS